MTRVKVVKNKVAPPFRKAEFEILFGEGISKTGEIVDLGVEYGIVKKSGAWFSYGDTKLGQGRDAAKRTIADNPELAEELESKIMAAMKEAKPDCHIIIKKKINTRFALNAVTGCFFTEQPRIFSMRFWQVRW